MTGLKDEWIKTELMIGVYIGVLFILFVSLGAGVLNAKIVVACLAGIGIMSLLGDFFVESRKSREIEIEFVDYAIIDRGKIR